MTHRSTMRALMLKGATATLAICCAAGISRAQEQPQTQTQPQPQPQQVRAQNGMSAGTQSNAAQAGAIGDTTRAWLELQRSNAAGAPALAMPGAQATLAYERYMNSFRTKIPASFGSALSDSSGGRWADYSNSGGGGQTSGSN